MKIALVFPKSTFLSDPLVWPPLGLWYIAAQLEAQGHETDFFDLSIRKLPKDGEFDQLWLSANSAQMYEVRKIAEQTKDWKGLKQELEISEGQEGDTRVLHHKKYGHKALSEKDIKEIIKLKRK